VARRSLGTRGAQVRDANDRIVSKGRGELNLILDHLSIDVTNPWCALGPITAAALPPR
jgi:hypothetical protein